MSAQTPKQSQEHKEPLEFDIVIDLKDPADEDIERSFWEFESAHALFGTLIREEFDKYVGWSLKDIAEGIKVKPAFIGQVDKLIDLKGALELKQQELDTIIKADFELPSKQEELEGLSATIRELEVQKSADVKELKKNKSRLKGLEKEIARLEKEIAKKEKKEKEISQSEEKIAAIKKQYDGLDESAKKVVNDFLAARKYKKKNDLYKQLFRFSKYRDEVKIDDLSVEQLDTFISAEALRTHLRGTSLKFFEGLNNTDLQLFLKSADLLTGRNKPDTWKFRSMLGLYKRHRYWFLDKISRDDIVDRFKALVSENAIEAYKVGGFKIKDIKDFKLEKIIELTHPGVYKRGVKFEDLKKLNVDGIKEEIENSYNLGIRPRF